MERARGELVSMQQMYSAIVAERDSLRDELISAMEGLQRVPGEREQERENNPPRKQAERARVQQPFHRDKNCRNHKSPLSLAPLPCKSPATPLTRGTTRSTSTTYATWRRPTCCKSSPRSCRAAFSGRVRIWRPSWPTTMPAAWQR